MTEKRKSNNPDGCPTKYRVEYCEQIIKFFKKGGDPVFKRFVSDGEIFEKEIGTAPALLQDFAINIGVSARTVKNWTEKFPEFETAYEIAKDIQLSQMIKGMISGDYSTAGIIFALKNMHGWRDKTEIESPEGREPFKIIIEDYTSKNKGK